MVGIEKKHLIGSIDFQASKSGEKHICEIVLNRYCQAAGILLVTFNDLVLLEAPSRVL